MEQVERPSVCNFDCPDTCSLTVTVEDGRIVKVRGSHASPYTGGVICTKVARDMSDFAHGPGRLRHPMRRVGPKGSGQFERTTWDSALAEVHRRMSEVIDRWGPEAVLPLNYAGPHGFLARGSMSSRFFNRMGASRVYRWALCGGVRQEAWVGTFGAVAGCPPEFADDAALNVMWGNNATVSNIHMARSVRIAKRKGGRLIVIDPLRTKIATQADLHLAIQPGTDVLLAWAVATEWERNGQLNEAFIGEHVVGFEDFMARAREWPVESAAAMCRVPEADIRTMARWMLEADPLVTSMGNGLERCRTGGSSVRAAIALPALLGRFGNGSGIALGAGSTFAKTMDRLQRLDLLPAGTRTLNINDIGRHLVEDDIDPPIRAMVIYNHNPIVVHPDQNRMRRGLERDDIFSVGIELTMTESMTHCDLVLPAASHFEHDDLYPAYGHHWLQRAEAVIPPVAESLPNTEIFRRLAALFGFAEPCFTATDEELMDESIDATDPRLNGLRPSQIPVDRAVDMTAPDGKPMVLFENVFPETPSGKIELRSETLAKRWGPSALLPSWRQPSRSYPLRLVSPASDRRISSTLGHLPPSGNAPRLKMHPADAGVRGLRHGQQIRIWNDRGEVVMPLEVTDAVPEGVVASEKGAWLSTSSTGQTISALVSSDDKADLAEGACFNNTPVEVGRAA